MPNTTNNASLLEEESQQQEKQTSTMSEEQGQHQTPEQVYQATLQATTPATFARTAAAYAASPPLNPQLHAPDLIDIIICDHANTLTLFSHFMQAAEAGATHIMGMVVGALSLDMRLHSQAEMQVLYPILQSRLGPEGSALAQRALAEHAMVEQSIAEMLMLRNDTERLTQRVKQCQTEFLTHMGEEETTILPRIAAVCSPDELKQLSVAFKSVKQTAPLVPQASVAMNAAAALSIPEEKMAVGTEDPSSGNPIRSED